MTMRMCTRVGTNPAHYVLSWKDVEREGKHPECMCGVSGIFCLISKDSVSVLTVTQV